MKIKQFVLLSLLCLLNFVLLAQTVTGNGTLKTTMVPFEATALQSYSFTCEPAATMKKRPWNADVVNFCKGYFEDNTPGHQYFIRVEEHASTISPDTKESALSAHRKAFHITNGCTTSSIKIGTLDALRGSCYDDEYGIKSEFVVAVVDKYIISLEYNDELHGNWSTLENVKKYFASLKYTGKQ